MTSKVEFYRSELRARTDWDEYLMAQSGLPGPRGNLELAEAVVEEGSLPLFRRYLAYDAQSAPTNTPAEFLAFCGTAGLGRSLADGDLKVLPTLRRQAGDQRWRVREAVAFALQRWGDRDLPALLAAMQAWSQGSLLERRAVVAGLCEPRLLTKPATVRRVLTLLDAITHSLLVVSDRRQDDFQALRKTLGYGWSVATAALPAAGQPLMEKWLAHADRDIRWIMKTNLSKNRLQRIDPDWVRRCQRGLERG